MEKLAMRNKDSLFKRIGYFLLEYNTEVILILITIVSGIISDKFLTGSNVFNVMLQISSIVLISMGMLFVVLTGGIDLSVGSHIALSGVIAAFVLNEFALSLPVALLIAIGVGMLFGALSGYFVAYRNMAAFIVTLAFMTIIRGTSFMISDGSPIMASSQAITNFGIGKILNIPYPVIFILVVSLILYLVARYTVFGRLIKAVGSNETAVELSGINKKFYKFSVYVVSGALAAMAGIIVTARTGVGSPTVAQGYELDAIAAVVVGGASLKGGKGTVLKTLFGAIILGIISNIMNLKNVPAYPQQVVKGFIILFAVFFEGVRRKITENS